MLSDQEKAEVFLKKLDREIACQWKLEKGYRRFVFALLDDLDGADADSRRCHVSTILAPAWIS
jgi:hypothetical protein